MTADSGHRTRDDEPFRDLAPPLISPGPTDFQGVVMRVFPLAAREDSLQRLCRRLLNLGPREVAEFRPALPYVFLLLVHYGRMRPGASNLGWVAQNEVAFALPLEWRRLRGGRMVFHDWAVTTPFIWVDSPLSVATGREVYGWPKRRVRFADEESPWLSSPRGRQRLVKVTEAWPAERQADESRESRVFLEIDQHPPPALLELGVHPPALWGPLAAIPEALSGSLSAARAGAGLAGRLWSQGPAAAVDGRLRSVIETMIESLSPGPPDLGADAVNLKQFRDAARPSHICYQALIAARMSIRKYNAGGLLGESQLLAGDPAAGFRIRIHRRPGLPIIEKLGLEVAEEHQGEDVPVATLKPIFPFWLDLEIRYDLGRRLCWRTIDSDWYTD